MKKLLSVLICVTMLLGVCAMLAACGGGSALTLNVYNWGEYISDGSEGSLDTIKAFEAWYQETYGQKIKVNYTTFASNEDMYNKLSSGAVSYDVVIPSDYMIAKMIEEGMLLPLNFDNIPNYSYIDESFHGLYYDPDNQYTVPYTYGVVGVIYNAKVVDEADAGDWDLLWNCRSRLWCDWSRSYGLHTRAAILAEHIARIEFLLTLNTLHFFIPPLSVLVN